MKDACGSNPPFEPQEFREERPPEILFNVSSNGYVGIGTSTPNSLLSISNSVATALNTPLLTIASTTAGTATTTVLTVLSNGTIGVGTTSPSSQLGLSGNIYVGGTGTSTIQL